MPTAIWSSYPSVGQNLHVAQADGGCSYSVLDIPHMLFSHVALSVPDLLSCCPCAMQLYRLRSIAHGCLQDYEGAAGMGRLCWIREIVERQMSRHVSLMAETLFGP